MYLYLQNDGFELGRAVAPLFEQLHGVVEVLHILCVHFEEGCEPLQDVSNARGGCPGRKTKKEGRFMWTV